MYLDRLDFKNDRLRGIDPRCRLGAGICLIAAAVYSSSPLVLGCLILGPVLCLSKDIPVVLRRLIPVNLFALILWLTLPLGALAGGPGPGIGGALNRALVYTLRINAAALLYMAAIIPLGPGGLANALIKLRLPHKLAALFLLTYRYIFVMYGRVFISLRSMLIRRPRQNTLGRWASYTAVFSAALVRALQRSRNIGQAMRVRGFTGVVPVTRSFSWKTGDTLFLGFCLVLAFALRVLDRFLTGASWNF
jgi:energy-coupling factor transporter transmembrane protein EcfT